MKRVSNTLKYAALVLALGTGGTTPARAANTSDYYRLQQQLTLKSAAPSWDYLTFDQARHYLFINRHEDGTAVVDVRRMQPVVGKITGTEGAGDVALATAEGLGFTSNEDGSTTLFKLSDFSLVKRIKFGSNADGNVYDPVSHRVAYMLGDDSTVLILDARDGKELGRVKVDGEKLERPVADGHGNIVFAMRDKNRVVKLDMQQMAVAAQWPVNCVQSNSVALDITNNRVFVSCRGDKPVLLVLDSKDGRQVASVPIGRGNDELIYDADNKQIFASNGVDSNLVVIRQQSPDQYVMTQAVMTRPGARTMAFDKQSKRIYLVTADGIQDPAQKVNRAPSFFYPNLFMPDSFVLLSYGTARD